MPRIFRLALAQINPTVGDIRGNCEKIQQYLDEARRLGADLVAFPEMAVTGYPPEDLLLKKAFVEENMAATRRLAESSHGTAIVVGYVHQGERTTNAAAVACDGVLVDTYHKIYLPNYGVFDEERYFTPGSVCPVYEIDGARIGVNVCEDIWYDSGPTSVQRENGAELIVNINASPFHTGKSESRRSMIASRAADNRLFVAYLNTVGGQDELVFDGNSIICGPDGGTVARGPAFRETLIVADLDLDQVDRSSLRRPTWESHEILAGIGSSETVHVSGYRTKERPALAPPSSGSDAAADMDAVEEVYRALVVGTRDYLGKTGFQRAMVGLSGGIDSALTATVAADALGGGNVLGITMPSRFSSVGSIDDSKELAGNLGIELWEVPIEPAHEAFSSMLEERFRGSEPNVAEENVQARIRGNVLMTISNKYGWIVLTTGNKSEMAMGYATLYGDMAGGFAVLKDVPKTTVYDLCRWRNRNGASFGTGDGVIPQAIIDKPPSAELKEDQLDQDTLPPYEVLDPVIKAYVEDDRGYVEMVDSGFDPAVVRQVMGAVDRNEYKRRQAPPGVKITPRAFGRDWRLPIVNRYRQV